MARGRLDKFLCGEVVTCEQEDLYMGADASTSMTAEVTAQVYAARVFLRGEEGLAEDVAVEIIYDNEVVADFARVVSESKRHE